MNNELLVQAILDNDVAKVKKILKNTKVDINEISYGSILGNLTLLQLSLNTKNIDMVKLLIKSGANVNKYYDVPTLFNIALLNVNKKNIIKEENLLVFLLENKVDVNVEYNHEWVLNKFLQNYDIWGLNIIKKIVVAGFDMTHIDVKVLNQIKDPELLNFIIPKLDIAPLFKFAEMALKEDNYLFFDICIKHKVDVSIFVGLIDLYDNSSNDMLKMFQKKYDKVDTLIAEELGKEFFVLESDN